MNKHIAHNVQLKNKVINASIFYIPTNAMLPSSPTSPLNLSPLAFFVHASTILSIYCPLTLHVASMSTTYVMQHGTW